MPAVVDEIVGRYELLTNVWGSPQSDFGRNQAWFEYASQLGELVGMEVVSLPVYSWGCAAGHAIRMAARITGRHEVLLPRVLDPERQAVIASYCEPREMSRHIDIVPVGFDPATGRLDLADLERKLSNGTAAVYVESPSYLGVIEAERCRDRRARPSARRPTDRRRRPDLPGRAEGAGRLGCGHRRRPDPAARACT